MCNIHVLLCGFFLFMLFLLYFFFSFFFVYLCFFFFFSSRRRHTRSLCDWSSDVCSSDLEQSRPGSDRDRRHVIERRADLGAAILDRGRELFGVAGRAVVGVAAELDAGEHPIVGREHHPDATRRGLDAEQQHQPATGALSACSIAGRRPRQRDPLKVSSSTRSVSASPGVNRTSRCSAGTACSARSPHYTTVTPSSTSSSKPRP